MKKISFAIIMVSFISFFGCNSGNEKRDTPIYDTTPTGPAPDNTNATHPSLSDSAVSNPDTSKTIDVE